MVEGIFTCCCFRTCTQVLFFVIKRIFKIAKIKQQEEADIASSAEHLPKVTCSSIVFQTRLSVIFQVQRELHIHN